MTEEIKSQLQDNEIINGATWTAPDEKGRVAVQFKLPDGHVVQSAHQAPDSFKGKFWMTWVSSVREVDEQRMADRRARKEFERHLPGTKKSDYTVPLDDDPEPMLQAKVDALAKQHKALLDKRTEINREIDAVGQRLAKWETLRNAIADDSSPA